MLEDLTALSSKEYLISIREAIEDYKHGRVKSIEEIDVDHTFFEPRFFHNISPGADATDRQ